MVSLKVLCQFWLEGLNKRFSANSIEIQKIRFFQIHSRCGLYTAVFSIPLRGDFMKHINLLISLVFIFVKIKIRVRMDLFP